MTSLFDTHVKKAIHNLGGTLVEPEPEPEPLRRHQGLSKAKADLSALADEELLAARDLFSQLGDPQGVKAVKVEMDARGSQAADAEKDPATYLANQSTPDLVAWYKTAEAAGAKKTCKLIKKELDRRGVDPNEAVKDPNAVDPNAVDPNAAPVTEGGY